VGSGVATGAIRQQGTLSGGWSAEQGTSARRLHLIQIKFELVFAC